MKLLRKVNRHGPHVRVGHDKASTGAVTGARSKKTGTAVVRVHSATVGQSEPNSFL